jgi:uncharacterized protein (TIGR03067 family)
MIVIACCLIAADAPSVDTSKNDLEAMQGEWQVVLMETSGKILPDSKVRGMTLTVKGDKMALKTSERKQDSTIQLDGTKDPKQVIVTGQAGKKGTQTTTWLYTVSGDDLRFCGDLGGNGGAPPTEMKTKAKDKNSLVVFKRKKPKEEK